MSKGYTSTSIKAYINSKMKKDSQCAGTSFNQKCIMAFALIKKGNARTNIKKKENLHTEISNSCNDLKSSFEYSFTICGLEANWKLLQN